MAKTMDRKIIITLAVLTLAFASLAQAKLERIEEAFELQLTQLSLPAHATDKVTVKACAGCDTGRDQLPPRLRVAGRHTAGTGRRRVRGQRPVEDTGLCHVQARRPGHHAHHFRRSEPLSGPLRRI